MACSYYSEVHETAELSAGPVFCVEHVFEVGFEQGGVVVFRKLEKTTADGEKWYREWYQNQEG